jgi:hypothetical protein
MLNTQEFDSEFTELSETLLNNIPINLILSYIENIESKI